VRRGKIAGGRGDGFEGKEATFRLEKTLIFFEKQIFFLKKFYLSSAMGQMGV
jgi:hypothetical protein